MKLHFRPKNLDQGVCYIFYDQAFYETIPFNIRFIKCNPSPSKNFFLFAGNCKTEQSELNKFSISSISSASFQIFKKWRFPFRDPLQIDHQTSGEYLINGIKRGMFSKYSLGSFFLKFANCFSKISTPSASPTFFRLSSFQFHQKKNYQIGKILVI